MNNNTSRSNLEFNLIIMFEYKDEPIQLIGIDNETRKLTINDEAIEFLKTIQSPMCVVGVAGIYRTGKSYLLNRIILN